MQGSNGNLLTRRYFANIQVAEGEDVTAPQISALSPPDNAVDVPVNAQLALRFNESINPISLTDQSVHLAVVGDEQGIIACTVSFSDNEQLVRIVPHSPLLANTQYQLTIDNVRDVTGNAIAMQQTRFTTGNSPQFDRPRIVQHSPDNQPSGVPLSPVISL